jgi:hypothetical protein
MFTIDPKVPLPTSFVNYAVRNLAGMLLSRILREATAAAADPPNKGKLNVYAEAIVDDLPFYKDWLLVKLRAFCAYKKWNIPRVAALERAELSSAPPQSEQPASAVCISSSSTSRTGVTALPVRNSVPNGQIPPSRSQKPGSSGNKRVKSSLAPSLSRTTTGNSVAKSAKLSVSPFKAAGSSQGHQSRNESALDKLWIGFQPESPRASRGDVNPDEGGGGLALLLLLFALAISALLVGAGCCGQGRSWAAHGVAVRRGPTRECLRWGLGMLRGRAEFGSCHRQHFSLLGVMTKKNREVFVSAAGGMLRLSGSDSAQCLLGPGTPSSSSSSSSPTAAVATLRLAECSARGAALWEPRYSDGALLWAGRWCLQVRADASARLVALSAPGDCARLVLPGAS